jgi:hypothetical protein
VAVDAYLRGHSVAVPRFTSEYHDVPQIYDIEDYAEAKRPVMPELPVEARQHCLAEVELGLDETAAREECKRCLRCDLEWLGTVKSTSEAEPEEYVLETAHVEQ